MDAGRKADNLFIDKFQLHMIWLPVPCQEFLVDWSSGHYKTQGDHLHNIDTYLQDVLIC